MKNKSERRKPRVGSFAEALERFQPLSLVSTELGLSYHTVWAWKSRDWIEPGYWSAIGALAARLRVPGVTLLRLAELGAQRSAERLASRKRQRARRPARSASDRKAASYQALASGRP